MRQDRRRVTSPRLSFHRLRSHTQPHSPYCICGRRSIDARRVRSFRRLSMNFFGTRGPFGRQNCGCVANQMIAADVSPSCYIGQSPGNSSLTYYGVGRSPMDSLSKPYVHLADRRGRHCGVRRRGSFRRRSATTDMPPSPRPATPPSRASRSCSTRRITTATTTGRNSSRCSAISRRPPASRSSGLKSSYRRLLDRLVPASHRRRLIGLSVGEEHGHASSLSGRSGRPTRERTRGGPALRTPPLTIRTGTQAIGLLEQPPPPGRFGRLDRVRGRNRPGAAGGRRWPDRRPGRRRPGRWPR